MTKFVLVHRSMDIYSNWISVGNETRSDIDLLRSFRSGVLLNRWRIPGPDPYDGFNAESKINWKRATLCHSTINNRKKNKIHFDHFSFNFPFWEFSMRNSNADYFSTSSRPVFFIYLFIIFNAISFKIVQMFALNYENWSLMRWVSYFPRKNKSLAEKKSSIFWIALQPSDGPATMLVLTQTGNF